MADIAAATEEMVVPGEEVEEITAVAAFWTAISAAVARVMCDTTKDGDAVDAAQTVKDEAEAETVPPMEAAEEGHGMVLLARLELNGVRFQ